MNINKLSKRHKYVISSYSNFALKFLQQKAKPLWDQQKKYTKAERDEALTWLARALEVQVSTRQMFHFVRRFKRVQKKRLRGYLHECIRESLPVELTLHITKVPYWIKEVEVKLQMLPKLVEECRLDGVLHEDKAMEKWMKLAQMMLMESHRHQRVANQKDAKVVAAQVGMEDYHLLYRLWTYQTEMSVHKYRCLLEAGDVFRDTAAALTRLEWSLLDTVVLYTEEFSVVNFNKLQPLSALYRIVTRYKPDEVDSVEPSDKWAKVVKEYSKKYVTSPSGVVLQRRWWELKQYARNNVTGTVGSKVHTLLADIADKHGSVERESEEWVDLVRSGKVYDVSVPKDPTQVRKVELPDRSSLKRHRAPTAHVAPIRFSSRHSDNSSESSVEVVIDGNPAEPDIDFLEQFTKETVPQRLLLEEPVKPKKPRTGDAHPSTSKNVKNVSDQNYNKRTDKYRRKKEEKKSPPAQDSDEEFDAALEWQRQKTIINRFFTFKPVGGIADKPTTNRKEKRSKHNRKLDILIKKLVVNDNRMRDDEIIDLDDCNDDHKNDDESNTQTQAAVESITNDAKATNGISIKDTVQVTSKSEYSTHVPNDIELTPLLTKLESVFVNKDDGMMLNTNDSYNGLVPIATKVEKLSVKKIANFKPRVVEKYNTMKIKTFIKTSQNHNNDSQPSTSKCIPSTSKADDNLICISDDSNDISDTVSVNGNNINETEIESLRIQALMKKHNIKNQYSLLRTNEASVPPIKPARRNSSNQCDNKKTITTVPVKVYDRKNDASSLKMMEVGPIGADTTNLLVVNKMNLLSEDTEKCPEITNVMSLSGTIDLDNDSTDGLTIDESAVNDSNDVLTEIDETFPRISNVMSVQYVDPKVMDDFNKPSTSSVEEKTGRGLGLIIQNVRSMPSNVNVDNKTDRHAPVNNNEEHYESDSDNLHIDESFSTSVDTENMAIPSTSKDPWSSNNVIDDNVTNQKAKDSVINVVEFGYGRASHKSIGMSHRRDVVKEAVDYNFPPKINIDILHPEVFDSDSSNPICQISNIESVTNMSKDNMNTSDSINDRRTELSCEANKPTTSISQSNKDNINSIDNKIDDLPSKDTDINKKLDIYPYPKQEHIINNSKQTINNDITDTESNKKQVLTQNTEDSTDITTENKQIINKFNLSTSSTENNKQDSKTTNDNQEVKKTITEQDKSEIDDANEKNNSKSKETDAKNKNITTENTVGDTDKPRPFLKLVPIQRLIEPALNKAVTEGTVTQQGDTKLRGRAMPFHCLTDDESSKGTDDETSGSDIATTSIKVAFISQASTASNGSHPKVWNAAKIEPLTSVLKRVDLSELSALPPTSVSEYIKNRDITSITLLCIDEWKPLWMFQQKFFILTNLKLPVVGPTYWTVGPRSQYTKLEMDDNASGSTIVGSVSVPDEVYLDSNWYKKLTSDPMIYAKIWYVVPNMKTCKVMLKCNVQMQLYSIETGAISPLAVLNESSQRPTLYKLNINNLDSIQVPELTNFVNATQRNKQTQIVIDGNLEPKDMFRKVTNEEVISLDSEDDSD